jgi:hypothetical protein
LRYLRTVEYVIPAKAGIQFSARREMDPGFCRGDVTPVYVRVDKVGEANRSLTPKVRIIALLLVAVLVACGDVTLLQVSDSILGTWTLDSVNGSPLPVEVFGRMDDDGGLEINGVFDSSGLTIEGIDFTMGYRR